MAAKKALYVLLPPVYKLFSLPYRPHFIPASTYQTLSTYPIGKVPSVIDLPSMVGSAEMVGLQSTMDVHEKFSQDAAAAQAGLRSRKVQGLGTHQEISIEEKSPLLQDHYHQRDASTLSNATTQCGDEDENGQLQAKGSSHSRFEDEAEALLRVERMNPPKSRFDVDIVSKLVVYAGIGALAVDGIPILFQLVGLGVPPVRV